MEEQTRSCVLFIESNNKLIDSIIIGQNGVRKQFILQCEDFEDMLGLQTEATGDIGGGDNIGYVDVGDWLKYKVDISYEGIYKVGLRHAGYACDFSVYIDSVYQKDASFAATSNWQDWKTTGFELCLPEGVHNLLIVFKGQGLNMNWFNFEWDRELDSSCVIDTSSNNTDKISDYELNNGLSVFPVPANNILYVKMLNDLLIQKVEIFSMEGKVIVNKDCNLQNEAIINTSALKSGIYFINVKSGNRYYRGKILINTN